MKKSILGNTGIEVSELCFGVLPIGPLQKNVPIGEASDVIALALEMGVTFLDTAQMYKTYPHIGLAIKKSGIRPIIASKATASSYEDMEDAIHEALNELAIDYIDIFHLHAARADVDIFEERKGALQCLLDYKKKGIIKAIGVATHNVNVAKLSATRDDIDIVFPILNIAGRGILEGTLSDMMEAVSLNQQNGKGVYLMKALGGGTLMDNFDKSMEFARKVEGASAIALGMVSKEEVLYNIKYFNGEKDLGGILTIRNKKAPRILKNMCVGCGNCMKVCHNEAISFDKEGKAHISLDKCIQCGYCMSTCPQFCIRIA